MNKYFRTTNFYIAVFFLTQGLELKGIDRTDPRRCAFIFYDTPEREKLLEIFNFGRENDPLVVVDIRKVFSSTKSLKDKLYSE